MIQHDIVWSGPCVQRSIIDASVKYLFKVLDMLREDNFTAFFLKCSLSCSNVHSCHQLMMKLNGCHFSSHIVDMAQCLAKLHLVFLVSWGVWMNHESHQLLIELNELGLSPGNIPVMVSCLATFHQVFLVSWGVWMNHKSHRLLIELNGLSPSNAVVMTPCLATLHRAFLVSRGVWEGIWAKQFY